MSTVGVKKVFYNLFILIIVSSMQLTNLKIGPIQLLEIVVLPFFLFLPKTIEIRIFLRYFLLMIIISFLHNPFFDFDYSVVNNVLKGPYYCSVGRFIELLSCLSFVCLFVHCVRLRGLKFTLNKILDYNNIFFIFICVLFVLELARINIFSVSYTESHRLRGFFIEGGPFGLFISMLYIVSCFCNRSKKEKFFYILLILLAQSKAGLLSVLAYYAIMYIRQSYEKPKLRKFFLVIIIIIGAVFSFIFVKIASNYIERYNDSELALYVALNDEDYATVAGRVSGLFIVTNMFVEHPVIGIGMGNYPVLRNCREYRGFFPTIPVYDATGLGGIIDILNQYGVIGFILWFLIMIYLYKKAKSKYLIFIFNTIFLFGVQLTFMYPWLLLGIIASEKLKTKG